MSIEIGQPLIEIPRRRYECFEINGGGSFSNTPSEGAMTLEFRGIADFRHTTELERTRVEVEKLSPGASAWSIDLDGQFVQLVATLGRFAPAAFANSFEPADQFEHAVRKFNGIPNKTEREDSWDIVYNEDGIE